MPDHCIHSVPLHPILQNHKDSKKKKVTKADLDQCKVALETQTRVAETLEHERDQAYDDYQFAQVLYSRLSLNCYSGISDKGPSEIGTTSLQRTFVSTPC